MVSLIIGVNSNDNYCDWHTAQDLNPLKLNPASKCFIAPFDFVWLDCIQNAFVGINQFFFFLVLIKVSSKFIQI